MAAVTGERDYLQGGWLPAEEQDVNRNSGGLGLGGMWSAHLEGLTLFKFLDLGLVSKAFATPLSLWTDQTLDKSPSEVVLDWSIWPPHL